MEVKTEIVGISESRVVEELPKTELVLPQLPLPEAISLCSATIVGDRPYQQDSLWVESTAEELLMTVCDGMGGLSGGEKASAYAVEQLRQCFLEEPHPIVDVEGFFDCSLRIMNKAVCNIRDGNGRRLECGTTVVSVYVYQNKAYWLTVGDSKIYFARDGVLHCPFEPHNYRTLLNRYLREGTISEAEYEKELPKGEGLTGFLGMDRLREFDISKEPHQLLPGDIVLLCSDGLYKSLTESQIENILEICKENFEETADLLVQTAEGFGKKLLDNISVICMKYNGQASQ